MSQEANYFAELDYNEYQRLINTVEVLTQEEYDFCNSWDSEETWKYMNKICIKVLKHLKNQTK